MNEITKKEFVSGSLWKTIEQFSTKGISLIVSLILARQLFPEDYGVIALTTVFTNLTDILIQGGFSTALIRKKEVDDTDYSSVLVVSFAMAVFMYVLIFLIAPFAATYYEQPLLKSVLRVIGLILFIQAFSSVRTAIVTRNMQFKLLFNCNFFGSVISGVIGIYLAYFGWGVWALVFQQLSQQLLITVFLFMKLKQKIMFRLNLLRIKEIFKFSLGVVGSSLLNYVGGSLYSVVIGKTYSVTDLGYYEKGAQLPMQLSLYTFGSLSSVLLPTLASYQNNVHRVKEIVRRVVRVTSYLIFPMMIGMAVTAEELIKLLLTERWLPAMYIMQYSCLYYMATPLMLINIQVFFAMGYSVSRLKTEVIRLLLMVSGLGIFGFVLKSTINDLALVCAVIAVVATIITSFETRRIISYSLKELFADILWPLLVSILMGIVVFRAGNYLPSMLGIQTNFIVLTIKFVIGLLLYLIFSIATKMDGYNELINIINGLRIRRISK